MTETDWLTCTSRPADMLRFIRGSTAARTLRLLGCACCRIVRESMPEVAAGTVSDIERYHDGMAGETEYTSARDRLRSTFAEMWSGGDPGTADYGGMAAVYALLLPDAAKGLELCLGWVQTTASRAVSDGEKQVALNRARRQICDMIREIIGKPFRLWKVVPDFLGGGLVQPDGMTVKLTDTARRLAEGIRADQGFDRLPILADALEEAGVTDAELLAHCRREGGHVRGCWALDVVLGKM
jgi:hypothetical protein